MTIILELQTWPIDFTYWSSTLLCADLSFNYLVMSNDKGQLLKHCRITVHLYCNLSCILGSIDLLGYNGIELKLLMPGKVPMIHIPIDQ